jgi:hypothetical protein
MIEVMITLQAEALQRFEEFQSTFGVRALVQEIAHQYQIVPD